MGQRSSFSGTDNRDLPAPVPLPMGPAVASGRQWRSFQFRPLSAVLPEEETRQFAVRLRRALRAAHGLGIALRMRWASGTTGGVTLGVSSMAGVRWVHFGLSSAYDLGQWMAAEDRDRVPPLRTEFIILQHGPAELPFPAPLDEPPWSETVLAQLRTIRAGFAVEWELSPDPDAPRHAAHFPQTNDARPREVRALTFPERTLSDRAEARRIGLRWHLHGRIVAQMGACPAETSSQLAHLLEMASHLDGGNRFVCRPIRLSRPRLRTAPVLTEAEIVGLFPPARSLAVISGATRAPDQAHLWLGRDLQGACVGLPIAPDQGRHLLVLGETGMGKSSLVVRLAWQAARWGSVILFDPIGDTAREFLSGIPPSRSEQVSWVTPAAPVLTLSLLQEVDSPGRPSSAQRERLLADVVAALRRVRASRYTDSSFWGPRLEEMLFQALRAAAQWPGASLAVAERLLTPGGSPWRSVPETAREVVNEVRRRIEQTPQDGDGARRLLSEITRSGVLREMLDADAPTWSARRSVAPGRIVVISGDAPKVGESAARYLLAVLLALVWNAVLEREHPSKTFLVLDEAQWYAHDSVAEMLRLGRRFNFHIWAVTQSMRSLPESVRDAFSTNSADVVLFRGDPLDVRDVSRWVTPVTPERIMRMPRGEAAVLIDKGSEIHWIRLAPPVRGVSDPNRFVTLRGVKSSEGSSRPSGPRAEMSMQTPSPPLGLPSPREIGPLLKALADLSLGAIDATEFTVRLADLRSRCSADNVPVDRIVRNGGRFLSSAGVIVRTGRDESGSYWVLARRRLAEVAAANSAAGPSLSPEASGAPGGADSPHEDAN